MANKYGTQSDNQEGFSKNSNTDGYSGERGRSDFEASKSSDAYTSDSPDDLYTSIPDVSHPSHMEVTVVARAVDDGLIYATESSWVEETKESNVHKISDAFRRTKENVTHKLHNLSDSVKSNVEHVSHEVKVKAASVSDTVKREVVAVDRKVKANPYLYAAAAVGVGFVLGRIFLSSRKAKTDALILNNYQASGVAHTGVHVRDQSRYA